MGEKKLVKLIEKGKSLKKDQFLIILLAGVLLMIVVWPVSNTSDKADERATLSSMTAEGKNTDINEADSISENLNVKSQLLSDDDYVSTMEEKIGNILSRMDNVGKAEVVITLKSSSEKIVEKDMPITRSNTDEQDSQGGSRIVNSVDSGETTIYETESGKSTPYVIKTTSPQIEGVLVVCEGAGSGTVSKNITDAIQVLFGIEPHKIVVLKMKN